MTSSVLFQVLDTASEQKIGVATLNRPQTLNGLDVAMCQLLLDQLHEWEVDDSVAVVILQGAGERAFCAGGDLQSLYQGMLDNPAGHPWDNTYARRFFDVEYRLDHRIHTYSKPILCWGAGIVMGGGVGLMMGASHRVVSDTTRFAMPEITIGLYPDVGGTWMFSRLPGGIGLFLALTGAHLGASDCRHLGFADYSVATDQHDDIVASIQAAHWSFNSDQNDLILHRLLSRADAGEAAPGPLQRLYPLINRACSGPDFEGICKQIASWADHEDPWLRRAAQTFLAGSPGSARLIFTLLRRVRHMSLADVFRQEYIVSLQCGVQGDFQEGIRALIIDKDRQPRWNPAALANATDEWVQRFFGAPWPDGAAHPLSDLGVEPGP